MFLKFTIFSVISESVSKIHEKCGTMGVRSSGSFRQQSQIFLTASSRKHIFRHFTNVRRYYYDELFQITLFQSFSQTLLLYYIFIFIFQDDQRAKFMADTCGWGSLPVRFKIHFLKSCWVCAPPRNIMSLILLAVINLPRDHFY